MPHSYHCIFCYQYKTCDALKNPWALSGLEVPGWNHKKYEQELNTAVEQAAVAKQEKIDESKKRHFMKATEFVVDKINEHASKIDSDSDGNHVDDFFKIDCQRKYRGLLSDINRNFGGYASLSLTLKDLWRICDSLETFPNSDIYK